MFSRVNHAIAGDGGPNVHSAKIKITAQYTWIINIYDLCHNLSLFMKDIGKLFKPMLSIVSGKAGVSEGIKSHSETCFSSSYYQVASVHTCMPPIKKCVQLNTLKFDTAVMKKLCPYIEDTPTHYIFMGELAAFINLLVPVANGLLTLKGQNTTCADVFYVWVCIAYHLKKALRNPSNGLTQYHPSQMMVESSHHIFLLRYYLHPHE
ncbi:hypothetical protein CPB84DRAFT_1813272 [Gymnopilus junonius]|uniref:DUF659 domain-containing protein n=1 Tax=Gymnopilus junonius TaxID=109634 RepID=A0A9P5TSL6_GYMJU|nr:hypothetical protein CPB84DRAFT_1813272 [Gymnopilus junonius]